MKLKNEHILILILVIGAMLRFWDYTNIPFTHDEFSAFFRIGFTDFNELIQKGVIVDTHPPGVQIFINYWALVFGDSPWIIKLPFTLMGLGAVYLIWQLGKLWYNETVATISASFMASLQFPIMYSQIARPYISGLFLTLLMAWYWSKLIKKPEENFWKNGLLFVLAGALSAYNHHFSLLFAAIIGFSGVFMLPRKHLLKYAGLGIGVFLLYTPNLSLFLTQLEHGGVGEWLAAPKNDFLWMFIRYIFHFSWLLLGVATLLFIASFFFKTKAFSWKKFLLFFSWFMIPFLIGFFYSRYRNPVIQYSVLIFSFPYLFFILFGKFKALQAKTNFIISSLIITLSTITLIYNRQHYKTFYNSPYRAILLDQDEALKSHSSTFRVIDSNPKMNHYYNEHLEIDTNYFAVPDSYSELEFKNKIEQKSRQFDKLFFGANHSSKGLYFPIIKEYFPTLEKATNYEGGYSLIFSKIGSNQPNKNKIDFLLNEPLSEEASIWREPIEINNEYSKSYSVSLDTLALSENDFINLQTQLKLEGLENEVLLVSDISKNGEVLHWSATNVAKFKESADNSWFTAHHSIRLSDLNLDLKGAILKTYIYNKSKSKVLLNHFSLSVRKGNPYLYGLYEPIED